MDQTAEVRERLNQIVDPCSRATGVPLGLVDMGLVDEVKVRRGVVHVRIVPTFHGCRFVPIFAEEIEQSLADVPWVTRVEVWMAGPEVIWDEGRISPAARERLAAHRRQVKRDFAGLADSQARSEGRSSAEGS